MNWAARPAPPVSTKAAETARPPQLKPAGEHRQDDLPLGGPRPGRPGAPTRWSLSSEQRLPASGLTRAGGRAAQSGALAARPGSAGEGTAAAWT